MLFTLSFLPRHWHLYKESWIIECSSKSGSRPQTTWPRNSNSLSAGVTVIPSYSEGWLQAVSSGLQEITRPHVIVLLVPFTYILSWYSLHASVNIMPQKIIVLVMELLQLLHHLHGIDFWKNLNCCTCTTSFRCKLLISVIMWNVRGLTV